MRTTLGLWALFSILGTSATLLAQTTPNVRYVHDEAGNLLGAIDTNGNTTIYDWDAEGRLVAVQRMTARSPVDLFFIIPSREDVGVSPGTPVTIHGIGFSAVPKQNQVTFNGVSAAVDDSTTVLIKTRVPAGARTGPVQVTVTSPPGTAVSRTPFRVNNCVNPPAGLVSWWTGDGHVRDSVGRHSGSEQGNATFAPGIDSLAFSLDGMRSYASIAHRPTFVFGVADFTLGFWMRTPAAGPQAVLNKRDGCPGTQSFWGIRLTPAGRIQAELASNGSFIYEILSATPVNDGNWHHIALLRQGASASLYIDAQLSGSVDTKDALAINTTAPMLIGNDPCIDVDRTRFYRGLIDEVQWFNRVLSIAEIQNIISARDTGTCRP